MVRRWAALTLLCLAACASVPVGPPAAAPDPAWTARLAEGRPTLVVFATVWCEPCAREWPQVLRWASESADRRVLYVVSGSAARDVEALIADRTPAGPSLAVVVDQDGRIARMYGVQATPTLFVHRQGAARWGPVHSVHDLDDKESSP